MIKLLDFESFLNESTIGLQPSGPVEPPKVLPSSHPDLITTLGEPEKMLPDKIYIGYNLSEIKIAKNFRAPQKNVYLAFNSNNSIVKDENGRDVKGGIYTHSINIPATKTEGLDTFICKTPMECSSLSFSVLASLCITLGINNNYPLITAIVKDLNTIFKSPESKTILADITSFRDFLMGLRNAYNLGDVEKSLGQYSKLGKDTVDPISLLNAVKKGLA